MKGAVAGLTAVGLLAIPSSSSPDYARLQREITSLQQQVAALRHVNDCTFRALDRSVAITQTADTFGIGLGPLPPVCGDDAGLNGSLLMQEARLVTESLHELVCQDLQLGNDVAALRPQPPGGPAPSLSVGSPGRSQCP